MHLVGKTERVWVSDIAKDGTSLVGHTKNYTQILLPGGDEQRARLMGRSAMVEIYEAARWSCKAHVLNVLEFDPTVARVQLNVIASEQEARAIRDKLTKGKRVKIKKPAQLEGCTTCRNPESCVGDTSSSISYSRYLTAERILIAGVCAGAFGLAYTTFARNRS
jgi:hypothetical protein